MRRKLLPLSAMMLMSCHGASSQEAPIQLEIKTKNRIIENQHHFAVSITLRNVSKKDEQLNITSCFSPHSPQWSSDNPDVHFRR
jgi:hypothetical protein